MELSHAGQLVEQTRRRTQFRRLAMGLFVAGVVTLPITMFAWQGRSLGGGRPELVWGVQGSFPGEFQKPRAIAIDQNDQLYIVDKSARIQVFSADGTFLRGWSTPASQFGKPTGLSFDRQGNLMVADTHYYRILFYTPMGELLEDQTIGGKDGFDPGEFCWVTESVQDSHGNFYISQYGDSDRIQKFSPDRQYITGWGSHGDGPLEFRRPQSLAVDEQDRLWVADSCNHRIQVFDVSTDSPQLVQSWGREGSEPGMLRYPYDLLLSGAFVYVCEFGNHRVQKFRRDGTFVASWGSQGREPGQLHNPWGIVQDSRGRLHVIDTYNQRVQRFRL